MKARVNHKEFFLLLNQFLLDRTDKDEQKELKETYVSQFTNKRTVSLREMQQHEYDNMILSMRDKAYKDSPKLRKLSLWRKKVIKILKDYHQQLGKYKDLSETERVNKAKGTAIKNQSYTQFNDIPVYALEQIYYSFLAKTKILENANKTFVEHLSE